MENKELQNAKPISLVLEELKTQFSDLIKTSNIHISLVELVLKDVFAEVQYSAKLQAQYEKEQYVKSNKEESTVE